MIHKFKPQNDAWLCACGFVADTDDEAVAHLEDVRRANWRGLERP